MTVAQKMRYKQLKAMDKTIRQHVNDEGYFFNWIALGVPDGSTDLDFQDYAEDEEDFAEFAETFMRIIKRMDKDPHELSREELANKFIDYLEEE